MLLLALRACPRLLRGGCDVCGWLGWSHDGFGPVAEGAGVVGAFVKGTVVVSEDNIVGLLFSLSM